jgi:DNA-binding transcriptional MerR regulator
MVVQSPLLQGGDVSSLDDDLATMSIGEVARRTGVTVPTLRAWERRYGLLLPVRTAGGHRRYREEDVRRVLAVLKLVGHGWAVGAAARQVARGSAASVARPVDELRDRLWIALEQALRDLPAGTEAAGPPGESPTTGQAEASAEPLAASGSSGTSVRAAPVRQRRQTAAAGQPDREVLETVHQATRGLLYITSAQEATEILAAAVHRLGGSTIPAGQADSWALPIDLSFGDGEPILPVAEPLSLARMQLEQVLPGLVEDARRAVQLLRRSEDLDG